jgi:hypothetical protein
LSDIEEMVEDAKKPGVFNIVDAVKNRAYPTTKIEVFIDEDVAFQISELNEAIDMMSKEMEKAGVNKKEVDELLRKRDDILNDRAKLIEEMGGTRYTFHIKGISEGTRQELFDKAVVKYPMEHEKNRNPFTGEMDKAELENVERDRYFTSLLWQAYITKITSPDGSEQEGITFDDAEYLRKVMPLAAISSITEAIEKMRAATALFMLSVNEDFLAKS